MTEILVLVDHVGGVVRRTTAELLTIARRLGEPSAVFIGEGIDQARDMLMQYGAEKLYVLAAPELTAARSSHRRRKRSRSSSDRGSRPPSS